VSEAILVDQVIVAPEVVTCVAAIDEMTGGETPLTVVKVLSEEIVVRPPAELLTLK
jgi:hypothetical protein